MLYLSATRLEKLRHTCQPRIHTRLISGYLATTHPPTLPPPSRSSPTDFQTPDELCKSESLFAKKNHIDFFALCLRMENCVPKSPKASLHLRFNASQSRDVSESVGLFWTWELYLTANKNFLLLSASLCPSQSSNSIAHGLGPASAHEQRSIDQGCKVRKALVVR